MLGLLFTQNCAYGNDALPASFTVETNLMVRFSQAVPAGTNTLYAVDEIPETALAGLFILASTDCTIKTNSTGSPTNTFSLKAGVPLAWSSISGNTYFGNPLSGNITSIYVTNAAACQLDIFAMIAG